MNGLMYWGMLLLGGAATVLLVMGLGLTWEQMAEWTANGNEALDKVNDPRLEGGGFPPDRR